MSANQLSKGEDPASSVGTTVDEWGWSTEEKLLMLATQSTVRDPDRLRSMAADANWDQVLEYAQRHGVVPAVADAVNTELAEILPQAVREEFQHSQQQIATSNLNLTRELREVVGELRANGFDILPYKGPVLCADVYDDIGGRQYGDIDLLVRREQIAAIKAFLESKGYTAQYERTETERLSSGQEWAYTHYRRDYPFYRAETDTLIELQWRVVDKKFPTDITLDTVWERRDTTSIAGMDIPVLSPEDRLLVLAVHGTRHYWERLEWICDIAALIESQSIDWETTISRATSQNAVRMFLMGPAIADRLYDIELPEWIRSSIASDPVLEPLVQQTLERLFDDGSHGQIELQRFQAQTLDRYRDKTYLLLWWLLVPTRSEIELVPLPRRASFLYHVVRPVRLLLVTIRSQVS